VSVTEQVDHPHHYGGKDNPYEAIKVIEAWGLGFCLGNAIKYISRAGKKDSGKTLEDLKKAFWYMQRYFKYGDTTRAKDVARKYFPNKVAAAWGVSEDIERVLQNVFELIDRPADSYCRYRKEAMAWLISAIKKQEVANATR
jgi:hypothetical protein